MSINVQNTNFDKNIPIKKYEHCIDFIRQCSSIMSIAL